MLSSILKWGFVLLLLILLFSLFPFPPLQDYQYVRNFFANIALVKNILSVFVLFLIICILIIGLSLGRYSFKIEKLSIGGVNILFDNSDKLFKRSVKNYLDSKRTLFNISLDKDNFEETLTSYFNTYNFLKDEMKILNIKRRVDRELYNQTNEILKQLNQFLTNNQNDFRRWYKFVSTNDKVILRENGLYNNDNFIPFHLTSIGDIQKNYYNYDNITSGFQNINKYFNEHVKTSFGINTEKWSYNA